MCAVAFRCYHFVVVSPWQGMPPDVLLGMCLDDTREERTLARNSAQSGPGYLSLCLCHAARAVMLIVMIWDVVTNLILDETRELPRDA